jgi:hypothetical protein
LTAGGKFSNSRSTTWIVREAAPAAVLGLLASLLATTPAVAAVNSFHAWITCDPVTNTIAIGVTGQYGVQPNLSVKVDFTVESGYYATATTSASIPAKGSVTTVAGRSTASGDLTVNGYTRSFPISNYLFYTEKVTATVKEHVRRHPDHPDRHLRLRPSHQRHPDV